MDQVKRKLINIAAILNLVQAGLLLLMCLVDGVTGSITLLEFGIEGNLFFIITLIVYAVGACFYIASGVLLLYAINNNGKNFSERKAHYISGIVLTALCGPLSLSAILLYCSLVNRGQTENGAIQTENGTVKEINQAQQTLVSPKTEEFKTKVEELRRLREEGVISDQEFKALLMKLL